MRQITMPAGIDERRLRQEAQQRRHALIVGGCSTYIIAFRGGSDRIICLCCGLGTSNTHDIKELWCSFCHSFHGQWDYDHPLNRDMKRPESGQN